MSSMTMSTDPYTTVDWMLPLSLTPGWSSGKESLMLGLTIPPSNAITVQLSVPLE